MKNIAIDLTPILPGGENGGAKIFILELIKHLSSQAPTTQFTLLTHQRSHQELALLERDNVKRVMAIKTPPYVISLCLNISFFLAYCLFYPIRILIKTVNKYLPKTIQTKARFLSHPFQLYLQTLNAKLENLFSRYSHQLTKLKLKNTQLLFCPFTAPTYHQDSTPTVCTIYDLQYQTFPNFFTPVEQEHRHQTFVNACAKAKKLISISNYTKETVIKHGQVDDSFVQTIYLQMAQRTSSTIKENPDLLKRLGLSPQDYLLYPANFWKHKNHKTLLAAFALAKQQHLDPSIKLVCTGAPNEHQQWLIQATKTFGLEAHVIFPGYLSNDELTSILIQAKGMIYPSFYEGFGIPIIEAFAYQIPVACSHLTSLPEIAQNAAILFDPTRPVEIANAIHQLVMLSTEERNTRIQAGLKRAADFSQVKHMADEHLAVFKELIHEN
ncbi:MAG: glycosyltransferase family 1 protein [Gammaproteobacteria bacterium]|nr:glycosyltransferase family 1 protein [Gammaproteobacteria bacterium]